MIVEENESKESESKKILERSLNRKRIERHEENSFKKYGKFALCDSSKIESARKNILKNHKKDKIVDLLYFT